MKGLNDISVYGNTEEEKSKETEWLSREGEEHLRRYQENQGQTEFKTAEWLPRKNATVREKIMTGELTVNLTGQRYWITFLNNTSMDWSGWDTLWWTCIFTGTILGFSCGTWDNLLWHTGSVVPMHRLSCPAACRIWDLVFLTRDWTSAPLHCRWFLTTRPLGSSLFVGIFKVLMLWVSLPRITDLFAVSSPPQLKTSSLLRTFFSV